VRQRICLQPADHGFGISCVEPSVSDVRGGQQLLMGVMNGRSGINGY
jgi:hypothetical protein